MVQSAMELDCMIARGEYKSIVLYSRRVVIANFVADRHYKMEDTIDRCSS